MLRFLAEAWAFRMRASSALLFGLWSSDLKQAMIVKLYLAQLLCKTSPCSYSTSGEETKEVHGLSSQVDEGSNKVSACQ